MTKASTKGLSIILDEGSMATKRNIMRMLKQNKNVDVYELNREFNKDKFVDAEYVKNLISQLEAFDYKENKHLYGV